MVWSGKFFAWISCKSKNPLGNTDIQSNNISISISLGVSKFQWKQFASLCKTQQALKKILSDTTFKISWYMKLLLWKTITMSSW
jgi:hypothetical protein